jgi:serine/threonine protein kinase
MSCVLGILIEHGTIYAGGANLWHTMFGTSRPRPNMGPLAVPMTCWQALSVYVQLLDAVDYMHRRLPDGALPRFVDSDNENSSSAADNKGESAHRGNLFCVHRDISPGNIMVSWPRGTSHLPAIKLVDFGLSEVRDTKVRFGC